MAANVGAAKEPSLSTPGVLSARVSSDSSADANQQESGQKPGWITTLRDDIDPVHSDAPVIACCFVSGICDSVAFNASNVFVSMQTGEQKSPTTSPTTIVLKFKLTVTKATPFSSPSAQPICLMARQPCG